MAESEMVEKVARSLAPLAWAALGTGDTLAHKNRRTASLRHARAAIEAMFDPTESMIEAGQSENNLLEKPDPPNAFKFLSREEMASAWEAMIDAALKP